MSTLLLAFWIDENDMYAYAETDEDEQGELLEYKADIIISHFDTIYDILEKKKTGRTKDLNKAIETLSALLIAPFAKHIARCNVVRISIEEELVRCAFDLLFYKGKPLFLQRSVCYQVVEGEGDEEPEIELNSALLIADLTTDPEEACRQVSRLIPHSHYLVMDDAELEDIEDAIEEIDALIVSAHGELDDDNDGYVTINDESIDSDMIEELAAWIVYFDSCQQGVNLAFLTAFQEESDVQFYLAPIISNDAGDSSTKTMVWFFTALLTHKNPIRALFETRKRLFDYYESEEKLDFVTTLNKAFAFRLYEFMEEEEDDDDDDEEEGDDE